jgi:hypothetical protein
MRVVAPRFSSEEVEVGEELKVRGPEYIFDQSQVRSYNLVFNAAQWEAEDPFLEAYIPCSLTVDFGTEQAITYSGAGCRYKGSVGSFRMYDRSILR